VVLICPGAVRAGVRGLVRCTPIRPDQGDSITHRMSGGEAKISMGIDLYARLLALGTRERWHRNHALPQRRGDGEHGHRGGPPPFSSV